MINVYHKLNPDFWTIPSNPNLKDEYSLVATVDSTNLGTAFELTNHIEMDWRKNQGVHVHPARMYRSSSVGDILELNNIFYAVAPVGFKVISVQ